MVGADFICEDSPLEMAPTIFLNCQKHLQQIKNSTENGWVQNEPNFGSIRNTIDIGLIRG